MSKTVEEIMREFEEEFPYCDTFPYYKILAFLRKALQEVAKPELDVDSAYDFIHDVIHKCTCSNCQQCRKEARKLCNKFSKPTSLNGRGNEDNI